MGGVRRHLPRAALDFWVLTLALFLCWPAFVNSGYGLSGDLVFSPQQPLTLETVGLGTRLPRAVPLDAVLGLLGTAVPGQVLFRVGILAGLVLAGSAAHRLAGRAGCTAVPQAVAATFAVWNPYTVERLALGQWALLLGYGALGWIVLGTIRWTTETRGAPWSVWAWTGLASLTPTGGLLAVVVAVVTGARGRGRTALLAAGCCLLQLPWVLPSVIRAQSVISDPDAVLAFRAGPDAPGGTLVSLFGLGGIWDLESVPTSRSSFLGVLAAGLVIASVAAAWPRLPSAGRRLGAVALGGLVLAMAPRVPGLDDLFRWVLANVPGGGLLRDSQKWLAPLVVLSAWSAGVATERLLLRVRERQPGLAVVPAVVAMAAPVLVLPDATSVTWAAVRPVTYPTEFADVRDHLAREANGSEGEAMVLLPWRAYRAPEWGNDRTASDPAWAWFDVPMLGSSALAVGRRLVDDEGQAEAALARASRSADAARVFAEQGVRWALVYVDDPDAPYLELAGLREVVSGDELRLYRVQGTVRERRSSPWQRVVVIGADAAVLTAWLAACGLSLRRRRPDIVR